MPLFEVPPEVTPPSTEEDATAPGVPQPEDTSANSRRSPRFGRLRSSARTGNLDTLERHQLITMIEELEERRRRDRLIWLVVISVCIHLLLFFGYEYIPIYIFHRPRVVNPADVMARNPQNFQFLDLPPDALKNLPKPKTNILSDKNRVAQTPHPTLDKKTLAQLEAMKPAGPPAPRPGQPAPPTPAAPQPQPTPQQPQPTQPQQPLRPTPQSPSQMANNNLPPSPQPNFKSMMNGTARDSINNAARSAESGGGMSAAGAAPHHQGINSGMEVLSDTLGVDFGPYMARLKYLIERAWWPLIPESAKPPLSKQGVVQIRFTILPDGTLQAQGMSLDGRSGDTALDRAAWGGITGAAPFPPLPKEYLQRGAKNLEIRGAFLYNLTPDQLH